jgi:membrane-associated protease RseP (regulator of RpoE activity)
VSAKIWPDTARFRREYDELANEEMSLREELGDDDFDRYLFANGRPNRVKAITVMIGSAAEQAGMKDGDFILTYDEARIFEWGELKDATTEGELGEYVTVDIMRDGQLSSLWVPRGPLGVRLGMTRVAP